MHQAINNTTESGAICRDTSVVGRESGFTFIEIMIAITIVSILAALALPSYGNYVREARRADGHLALLQEAQTMERCRSTSWSYASCSLTSATSPENYYTVTVVSNATTYTLTATAANAQANDAGCSPMTINHLGARLPADCWKD